MSLEYINWNTIMTAVSVIFAIYQIIRVEKLKKYRIKSLRLALETCTRIMSDTFCLTSNPSRYGISDITASDKIRSAHTDSTILIMSFFHELSELDKPWNQKTLDFYCNSGLITSKWMWKKAAAFVDKSEKITMPEDLPENTIDWIDGDDKSREQVKE